MARANVDSFNGFIGKVGDTVTYLLNGKVIKRKIGYSSKPATIAQLSCRQDTPVTNDFLKPVKEFIKIGFKAEAKLAKKNANSIISSYTRKNAIKGVYPYKEIDFTKVLFSKGSMPLTPNVKAGLTENGMQFSWDKSLRPGDSRPDDQVMLMVYFPESKTAEYTVNGGARSNYFAKMPLIKQETPMVIETYISFISADRENVSNSIYTGQFILPANTYSYGNS